MRLLRLTFLLCATGAQAMTTSLGPLRADEPTQPGFSHTRGESLIVSSAANKNEFLAYSSLVGKWSRHSAPTDLRITPVVEGNVCALAYSGGTVSELVAVDRHGNWRTHELPAPTKENCDPFCNDDMAVYTIDGRLHVFSAMTGTWDTLSLPGLSTILPEGTDRFQFIYDATQNGTLSLRTKTHVAAFSVNIGRWACTPLDASDG